MKRVASLTSHGEAPRPERILWITEALLLETWRALRNTAEVECEGVVMWATPAPFFSSPIQCVTSVLVPRQRCGPGRYEIPPDAVRQMGRTLRERKLVNIAQVHTHPGSWVGHSSWDDTHSYSLRDGALSIVWPGYGVGLAGIEHWGIHECDSGVWRRLTAENAQHRVRVLSTVIDQRVELEQFTLYESESQDVNGESRFAVDNEMTDLFRSSHRIKDEAKDE